MTPYAAALFAAREVRENDPEVPSTGAIFQVVNDASVLSVMLDEMPEALMLADVLAGLGAQLILVADAYHCTLAEGADLPEHGDLQARHLIGDPTVTEALIVAGAKRSEEAPRVTVLPYDRASGSVLWLTPLQLKGRGPWGRLVDGLTRALASTPAPDGDTTDAMRWAAVQLTNRGIPADVTER